MSKGCSLESRGDLNGATGVVTGFDDSSGRWKVQLQGSRETKLFKAANLQLAPHSKVVRDDEGTTTFFIGARICIQDPDLLPKSRKSATITSWDELFHKWSIQWPDIDNTMTSYYSTEELNKFASLVQTRDLTRVAVRCVPP